MLWWFGITSVLLQSLLLLPHWEEKKKCATPVRIGVLYFHVCSPGNKDRRSSRQKNKGPELITISSIPFSGSVFNQSSCLLSSFPLAFLFLHAMDCPQAPAYNASEEKLFYQRKGRGLGRSWVCLTYSEVSQAASTEMSWGFLKVMDDNFLT